MSSVILTTLNARYTHASIGLRYLYANMGDLQSQTVLMEFTINDQIQDVAEQILAARPKVVGIGVYIWNAEQSARLLSILKKVSPETMLVVGGPEVSHEPLRVQVAAADYIIRGEADLAFYRLVSAIFSGVKPKERVIQAPLPDLAAVASPYACYTDEDIAHRYIYVEASRGCPFQCEFCLSSMDNRVRNFETNRFLADLDMLWQRGVRNFKFIDRTFNLNIKAASRLLDFFLAKREPYFVHFEVIPDHFPAALKERLSRFPSASLQLEIGIQTLNAEVAKRIQRKLNIKKVRENIAFLEHETAAHMHLDLIVGLPGESLESFGRGLNALCAMSGSEIQIGILKKLAGTPLHRHDEAYGMVYADQPPYDILKNNLLGFEDIQRMKRFARFWNLYYNSGNFKGSVVELWPKGDVFEQFFAFSLWVYQQTQSTWKISLERLAYLLFRYRTCVQQAEPQVVATLLLEDIMKLEGRKVPGFLKPFAQGVDVHRRVVKGLNKRQQRHLS